MRTLYRDVFDADDLILTGKMRRASSRTLGHGKDQRRRERREERFDRDFA